jgi:hypothetical protein
MSRIGGTVAGVVRFAFTAALALFSPLAHAAVPAGEPTHDVLPERPSLVTVLPRLGLVPWGFGSRELECRGNCAGFAGTNDAYEHLPSFSLGGGVLFGIGRYLRLGPSFEYTFTNDVDIAGRGRFEVGDDFTVDAVVEGFFPIAPRWGIAPHVQGGLLDLMPGGDLRNYIGALRAEFCPILDAACAIPDGARLGWEVGVGAGVWFRAHERVRLRLDVLIQYYELELYSIKAQLFGNPIEAYETLSGGRLMLTAGVELF